MWDSVECEFPTTLTSRLLGRLYEIDKLINKEERMAKLNVVGLIAALVVGLGAVANGAVIFQDNFSDGLKSSDDWSASNSDYVKMEFRNGACVVNNTSSSNSGLVFHVLPTKPTVFTISTKITKSSAATTLAGLAVGYNTSTSKYITFLMGTNAVYIASPADTNLPGYTCPFITDNVNTLTVSMNGSVCNVFVNNNFVTTFTYTGTPGGDIAYIFYPGVSVSLDDFMMVDTFTTGSKPVEYTDNFENGLKAGWETFLQHGTATVDSGKLKLKTANDSGSYVYLFAGVNLTAFTGKAAFIHKDGSTTSSYGLIIEGDEANQQATFAIIADRHFGAFSKNGAGSSSLVQTTSVRGKAYKDAGTGVITYKTDTLEIIKRAGSNQCVFFANGDSLISLTGINFTITKVGVFCQDSLDLTVDDFSFKPEPTAVKRHFITNHSPLKANQSAYRGLFVFDPLGRSVVANRVLGSKASSGVYFTKNKQNSQMMMIVKNQK